MNDVDAQEIASKLREAVTKYKVLFFRDQSVGPVSLSRLARYFGNTEVHHYYRSVDVPFLGHR
jgi:alpha-ketoglutarate-dependent taurine dioxygenase